MPLLFSSCPRSFLSIDVMLAFFTTSQPKLRWAQSVTCAGITISHCSVDQQRETVVNINDTCAMPKCAALAKLYCKSGKRSNACTLFVGSVASSIMKCLGDRHELIAMKNDRVLATARRRAIVSHRNVDFGIARISAMISRARFFDGFSDGMEDGR